MDAGEANPVGRRTSAISREPSSAGACDQLGPQILNELAHRVGDGFDALEVENALMDAFDIVRLNNPAIEDARLIAGFFLVIAADPAPDGVVALRARRLGPDRGNQSSRRTIGI